MAKTKQRPFMVNVREAIHRNIVVYATDTLSALEITERLAESGEIDMDGAEYEGMTCDVPIEIDESNVANYKYIY